MPGLLSWVPRSGSARTRRQADSRHADYETTMAAAARRVPVSYPISYEDGLAGLRLPAHPPSYDEVVNAWPYRYPARRDQQGNPVGLPPRYGEGENSPAEQEAPPSYREAMADKARALENALRNFSRNMRADLSGEFLLPFPGEAEVSEAGGSRTAHGQTMDTVRSTRLARQDERLTRYRRGLDLLRERIDGLSANLEDPEGLGALREMHASVAAEYGAHETAHEGARSAGIPMHPLADEGTPFEQWDPDSYRLRADAVHLFNEMDRGLTDAFERPLPRVNGLRPQVFLSRARRNELRFERAAMLDFQGELLSDYAIRLHELEARRTQAEPRLAKSPSFSDELNDIFGALWELYLPFRAEHDRQLSR